MLYDIALCVFLIVEGLAMVGAVLPQLVRIIGGVCGILAGVVLLIGIL